MRDEQNNNMSHLEPHYTQKDLEIAVRLAYMAGYTDAKAEIKLYEGLTFEQWFKIHYPKIT